MSFRTIAVTLFTALLALLALIVRLPAKSGRAGASGTPVAVEHGAAGSTPVLVELFTSEGCSSCPPADALLLRLGRTQPIREADVIVLEEHVNYWDNLGWEDPFSSEAATERQQEYGQAFGGRQVYTPQMIVDGSAEFVGSAEDRALRAVRAAGARPKPAVSLSWIDGGMLRIHVEPFTQAAQGEMPEVFLAITENMLHSDVKRGENAGRGLEHDGVVRRLIPVGKIESGPEGFSSAIAIRAAHEWNLRNLRAVAFVQERRSRRILAAAATPFPRP